MDRTVSLHFQEVCIDSILALPQNKYCADCRIHSPDWVSLSYGALVCYKCSGIHRSLGVQKTRVKSIRLDTWTLKQLFFVAYMNNENCNDYWEALLPKELVRPDPSLTREMTEFIVAKYVDRTFVDPLKPSPISQTNEKINDIFTNDENIDPEMLFRSKQDELKRLLKLKMLSTKSPNSPSQSLNTSKMRSIESAIKLSEKRHILSEQKQGGPVTSSPVIQGRLRFNFNLENTSSKSPMENSSNSRSHESLDNFPLFEGLTIKTSPNVKHQLSGKINSTHVNGTTQPPKQFLFIDDHHSGISFSPRGSKKSLNESIESLDFNRESKGIEIHSADERTPKKSFLHKKSQFARKPSIEDRMEEASDNRPSQDEDEEFTKGEFKGFGEDMRLPQLYPIQERADSYSVYPTPPIRPLDRHESITKTLLDARKENVAHLKRPSEAFIPSQTILDEAKGLNNVFGVKSEKAKRYLVVFDCILIHLLLGYLFSWGALAPYVGAIIADKHADDDQQQEDYLFVYSLNMLLFFGMAFGYRISERAINVFGMKKVLFSCFLAMIFSLLISVLSVNFFTSAIFMTLLPGVFIGAIYQIPYFYAIQHFPLRTKELKQAFPLVNGIGAFFFINLFPFIVKQLGVSDQPIYFNQLLSKQGIEPMEIRSIFSTIMLTIILSIVVLGGLASFLFKPKLPFVERDWLRWGEKEEGLLSNDRNFYISFSRTHSEPEHNMINPVIPRSLFTISTFYFTLGGFLFYSYKVQGFQYNLSDQDLCIIGGFGMLLFAIGRGVSFYFFDKYSFKLLMKINIMAMGILGVLGFFMQENKTLFVISFMSIILFSGIGYSALMQEGLRVSHNHNHEQPVMGAIVLLGFTLSNLLSFILLEIIELIGIRDWFYLIHSIPLVFAYVVLVYYPDEKLGLLKKLTKSTQRSTFRSEA